MALYPTTKIISLYSLKPVTMAKVKIINELSWPDPKQLIGVELEIENARGIVPDANYFRVENDGSLRNNGVEYITLPMTIGGAYQEVVKFWQSNKIGPNNFSERCSIHVHWNVQDWTLEELASLLLIYQTVEHVYFDLIAPERKQGVFCVPVSETHVSYRSAELLSIGDYNVIERWQKYMALNLAPVRTQGTVEWRHFPGIADPNLFRNWLLLTSNIMFAAKSRTYKEWRKITCELNSNSEYLNMLGLVFGSSFDLVLSDSMYRSKMEKGVLAAKYSYITDKEFQLKNTKVADLSEKELFARQENIIFGNIDQNNGQPAPMLDWAALHREMVAAQVAPPNNLVDVPINPRPIQPRPRPRDPFGGNI